MWGITMENQDNSENTGDGPQASEYSRIPILHMICEKLYISASFPGQTTWEEKIL